MQRPQRPANDQVRPPFQQNLVENEYVPKNEEDINSFGDQEERCFLTKQQHYDQCNDSESKTKEYQKGYQNLMIAFQRQLNLRNRYLVISNPHKKVVDNQASTSAPNNNTNFRGSNNNQIKAKDKSLVQDSFVKNVENRKDVVIIDKTIVPFIFETKISKLKVSLPFNEICRNNEYRNQLLKMLRNESKFILSNVINIQDDTPVIVFCPIMENIVEEYVPPFYVTLKIQDLLLHNTMIDSSASHNLMQKEVMDNLGLDITTPYKDLFSFYSRKYRCMGMIKDLVVSLHQILEKSIVMDIVVADVPTKFGMLLSRSWASKLKGTMQMDI